MCPEGYHPFLGWAIPPAVLCSPQAQELQGAAGCPHMSVRPIKESKNSWWSPGFPDLGFIQEFGKAIMVGWGWRALWADSRHSLGAVGGPGLEEGK